MKIKIDPVGIVSFVLFYCAVFLLTQDARGATATTVPGKAVTISVVADGTAPFSYQWVKDGTDILNATANPLLIPIVSSADSGVYTVKVSNAAGSTVSDGAILTVIPTGTITLSINITGASMPMGYIETYQWLKEGKTVLGGTSSYTFTDLTPHKYQVIITWYKLSPIK